MKGFDCKSLRNLVANDQMDPVLDTSKHKKRKKVKEFSKAYLTKDSPNVDGGFKTIWRWWFCQ